MATPWHGDTGGSRAERSLPRMQKRSLVVVPGSHRAVFDELSRAGAKRAHASARDEGNGVGFRLSHVRLSDARVAELAGWSCPWARLSGAGLSPCRIPLIFA